MCGCRTVPFIFRMKPFAYFFPDFKKNTLYFYCKQNHNKATLDYCVNAFGTWRGECENIKKEYQRGSKWRAQDVGGKIDLLFPFAFMGLTSCPYVCPIFAPTIFSYIPTQLSRCLQPDMQNRHSHNTFDYPRILNASIFTSQNM